MIRGTPNKGQNIKLIHLNMHENKAYKGFIIIIIFLRKRITEIF